MNAIRRIHTPPVEAGTSAVVVLDDRALKALAYARSRVGESGECAAAWRCAVEEMDRVAGHVIDEYARRRMEGR